MSLIALTLQALPLVSLAWGWPEPRPVHSVSACINGHPTVEDEYARCKSVFIGTVLAEAYEPPSDRFFDEEGTTYTVEVNETLRGRLRPAIRIFSENSSGRFPMQVGTRYLLFVYSGHGRTLVDSCGNSEAYTPSSPVLKVVRKLKADEKR